MANVIIYAIILYCFASAIINYLDHGRFTFIPKRYWKE